MLKYQIIPVTHYQQNCSLVWCSETNKAAVIDPGGDVDAITQAALSQNVTIEKIWLTHGHLDHVGGALELSKALGLDISGPHKGDQFWLAGIPQQSTMMGFPAHQAFEPQQWLDESDQLTIGQLKFQVLHCPGHTPGHLVFFEPTAKLAFVGDVLFAGSVGRTDFPQGNSQQLVESIRTKLWPLGDDVQFVPGHGPMSNFGHERKTNPFVADTRFG
jgi:glyoxylase-like metal-dependent hydrolase (beta-lactamase superfamily II)